MTVKISTGLRNEIMGKRPSFPDLAKIIVDAAGNTDFVDSGSSPSGNPEIQNTVDDLSIYAAGDIITVGGPNSNNDLFTVTNVQGADAIEVQEEVVAETAQSAFLGIVDGGSLAEIFKGGVLVIFEGTQPTNADADESGYTKLCTITRDGGGFTAGDGRNGLFFEAFGNISAGTLKKRESDTWSGVNSNTGTAGWFRLYDNEYVTGQSETAKRIDGAVATSGAQLNLRDTALFSGIETVIGSFGVTIPAQR